MNTDRWSYLSHSPAETLELGAAIAQHMAGSLVLGMTGSLGAGKTLLVRGIATANANAPCEVTSPTFTLIQEYPGRLTVYHLDVYRLTKSNDPLLLGLEEMIRPDSVVIIEWAERVRHALPIDMLWIELVPTSESARHVHFTAGGPNSRLLLETLRIMPVDRNSSRS